MPQKSHYDELSIDDALLKGVFDKIAPDTLKQVRKKLASIRGQITNPDVVVATMFAIVLSEMRSYVAVMQRRIATLEERPSLKYCGVLDPARQYNEGEFVTYRGSLWHCNRSTRGLPGASSDFTLVAKRGADGRDGKGAR